MLQSPPYASTSPFSPSIPDSTNHQDIQIIRKLAQGTFPVYLVANKTSRQYQVMKIFPYHNSKPHPRFVNEIRFSFLKHVNIIKFIDYKVKNEADSKGQPVMISYILSEFAPYGTFFEVFKLYNITFDEKLARTYFHQLIEGLEYLHKNNVAHLDLKLENLFLDQNFRLKIADFDVSYNDYDKKILTKGTKFYRALELPSGRYQDHKAADVYSAGILLFLFQSGGFLPQLEENLIRGVNLLDLMYKENSKFWEEHCRLQEKDNDFFEEDFKRLFNAMTALNPDDRPSISQVKEMKWYKGEVYNEEEAKEIMKRFYNF